MKIGQAFLNILQYWPEFVGGREGGGVPAPPAPQQVRDYTILELKYRMSKKSCSISYWKQN